MSQEKVDRYKKDKANRKKEVAKKKKNKVFTYIATFLVSVALIVLIVLSTKVLKGDFTEEETTTYDPAYLEQISSMFSEQATTEETTTPAQ